MAPKNAASFPDLLEHIQVVRDIQSSPALLQAIEMGIEICIHAFLHGGKLLLCGNGGSAADSQHLATELTVCYTTDRQALPAIALTTDTSTLTAAGNDYGYDSVFSRQVEALGRPGDILIGFSTSGRSNNVLAAIETALERDMKVVFFGGGDGGAIGPISTVSILAPSTTTARIQEMHILIGHIFCGQIERRLGLVSA